MLCLASGSAFPLTCACVLFVRVCVWLCLFSCVPVRVRVRVRAPVRVSAYACAYACAYHVRKLMSVHMRVRVRMHVLMCARVLVCLMFWYVYLCIFFDADGDRGRVKLLSSELACGSWHHTEIFSRTCCVVPCGK